MGFILVDYLDLLILWSRNIMSYPDPASTLNGGSKLSHGLQTTAIYWETWQTPFRGFLGSLYGSKWSWKLFDNDVRRSLFLSNDVRGSTNLMLNELGINEATNCRNYEGSSDFCYTTTTRDRFNFSFFLPGSSNII